MVHCQIINGKEVEVSREDDTSDSEDTNSSKVPVVKVTCIQQSCKKEELETPKIDHNQQKERKSFTERYIPPQVRSHDNLKVQQLLF